MAQNYTCQFDNHGREAIIGFCLNQNCNLPPQCCLQCIHQKHLSHFEDCKGFQSISNVLECLINEKQGIENHLTKMLQEIQEQMFSIEKSLKQSRTDQLHYIQLRQMLKEYRYFEFNNNIQMLKIQYSLSKGQVQKSEKTTQNNSQQKIQDLAEIYYNQGLELMKQEKWEDSIQKFDKAMSIDQQNCDIISSKGRALWKLQKYEDAFSLIETGLTINDNHFNLNLLMGIYTDYLQGNVLFCLQDSAQALTYLNKAISLDPKNSVAYNTKGNCLQNLGNDIEAIECYDAAIKIDSNYTFAYNNKGSSLNNLQRYKEAILCYDQAIQLDPRDPMTYCNKGISLSCLHQYEEAILNYDQAILLDQNCVIAYNNKGKSLQKVLGNSLNSIRKYQAAILCYDKAIKLDSNYADAYNNKGSSLNSLQKYDEAIQFYEKAIELDPDCAYAYKNKGFALENLKQNKKAIECYRLAVIKGYQPKQELLNIIKELNKL